MLNTIPQLTAKPLITPDELAAISLVFRPGSRVLYKDSAENVQGEGRVVALARSVNDAIVTVCFDGLGTHNVLSRFLELI